LDAAADTISQTAAQALGAVTAFAAGAAVCCFCGRFSRKEFLVAAALYWWVTAADAAGIAAVWVLGVSARTASGIILAGYFAGAAAAFAAARRGLGKSVAAAAATLVARWALSEFFAWTFTVFPW